MNVFALSQKFWFAPSSCCIVNKPFSFVNSSYAFEWMGKYCPGLSVNVLAWHLAELKKQWHRNKYFVGSGFLSLERKPLSFKSSLTALLIFLRFLMLFFLWWTKPVARRGRFTELNSAPSPTQTSAMPWITWESPTATRLCPWMPARSWIWGLAVPSPGDSSHCRGFCQRFRSEWLCALVV